MKHVETLRDRDERINVLEHEVACYKEHQATLFGAATYMWNLYHQEVGNLKGDIRTLYQVIGLMELKRAAIRADVARLNETREEHLAIKRQHISLI
jgi:hypothetical protein